MKVITSIILMLSLSFSFSCSSEKPDKEPSFPEETPQEVAIKNQIGKSLFINNCAMCHNRNMRDKMTAPPLGGVTKRRDQKWLYDYTRNSIKMVGEGDSIAVTLYEEYNRTVMNSFPNLSDEDLKNIYDYVEEVYQKK